MKKIIILLLSFYFLPNLGLNAALDTFPPQIKSLGIRNNLFHIHKRDFSSGKVLSIFSIKDFTKNQVDSFLLALNDDNLINPYLILSTGLWQMDSKDVHQRLCSFISLDTLDYSGKWGENRRPAYNKNEWAARLALARLGYPYHIDFIKSIFQEQDISHHRMADKLILYTRYINKKPITDFLLDLALKDHYYSYFDYDNYNSGAGDVSYYLSAAVMANYGLRIEVAEKDSYPKKRRFEINDNDIAQFKQWVLNSNRENIVLEKDSLLIDRGYFLTFDISIKPKNTFQKQLNLTQPTNRGSKNRPHINYQGACYFQGDTIFVNRQQTERIWLMAWRGDGQIMGSNSEWQGVSATEMGTYARIDKRKIPRRKPRTVSVRCAACGEEGEEVGASVFVVGQGE